MKLLERHVECGPQLRTTAGVWGRRAPKFLVRVVLVKDVLAALMNTTIVQWPAPLRIFAASHCAHCGKILTDEVSRNRAIGPDCWQIVNEWPAIRVLTAILDGVPEEQWDDICLGACRSIPTRS